MSVFWEYFRKTLRWPFIWADGPLALVVKGGAMVLDQAREDILSLRGQANPETCDAEYLDRIAAGRGVTRWPNEPDGLWRTRVVNAFKFNKTGGRKDCIHQLFEAAGIDAQIIESHEIFAKAREAGGAKVDGNWSLDGAVSLLDFYSMHGFPYVTWAEFAVKIDLTTWQEWDALGRKIVNEYKPARSKLVSFYGLYLEAVIRVITESWASMTKEIYLPYPWCSPRLDGSWDIGTGGNAYVLDGVLSLNGDWQVGGATPALSSIQLKQCNIFQEIVLKKEVVRSERYVAGRLGESGLKLDRGWQVGMNRIFPLSTAVMSKDIEIDSSPESIYHQSLNLEINYPASPQALDNPLKLAKWRQLDGGWSLGGSRRGVRLDGAWPVRQQKGVDIAGESVVRISGQAVLPGRLGSYPKVGSRWAWRLNGAMKVGAYHNLDGSWHVGGDVVLGAQKIGTHYKKLDGAWCLGDAGRQLPFSFHTGPQCEFTINRRG